MKVSVREFVPSAFDAPHTGRLCSGTFADDLDDLQPRCTAGREWDEATDEKKEASYGARTHDCVINRLYCVRVTLSTD